MDPEYTFRTEAEVERAGLGMLVKRESLANYAQALKEWRTYKSEVSEATNRPVTVILSADQDIAWSHVGETLGDYPAPATVLDELRKLSRFKTTGR